MALSPLSPEPVIAANKAAIDTLLAVFNSALDSAEKLAVLNLATTRSALQEQLSGASSLLSARDAEEALALQGNLARPQIERAIAYARDFYEISSQAREHLAERLELHQSEIGRSFAILLDFYSDSTPVSSPVSVAAVKSAVSAANSAFDNVNRAARQVATITGAGVDAVANAAARSVGAAAQAKRKAA